MANSYSTEEGTLYIPGAYGSYKVQQSASGTAQSGVIALVGEAETGLAYDAEDIADNFFTPEQDSLVRAKYTAGPLVDAFLAAARPANSPDIPGGPTRIYIAKTNIGTRGELELKQNGELYGSTIQDKLPGARLVTVAIEEAVQEALPVTPPAVIVPGAGNITFRVNGGALQSVPITGADTAETIVGKVDDARIGVTGTAEGETVSFTLNSFNRIPGRRSLEVDWTDTIEILDDNGNEVSWKGSPIFGVERKIRVIAEAGTTKDTVEVGGDVALQVGNSGVGVASVTVAGEVMTLQSGAAVVATIPFSQFKTVGDVAARISMIPGWTAKATNPIWGSKVASALDEGTYNCSGNGMPTGIKMDAALLYLKVQTECFVIEMTGEAPSGLPDRLERSVLEGGAKGATSNADVVGALDTLKRVISNFVVPCFSRDAEFDIEAGLTDPDSTYAIDAINTATRAHCNGMSTKKIGKWRQGFCSYKGSFKDTKTRGQDLSSALVSLAFQDVRAVGADGSIKTFPPHVLSAIAAGMQAGGGYRSIFAKGVNCNGVLHREFKSDDDGQVEEAIEAGLLVARRTDTGGYEFVSDQTTYSIDSNDVYNSIQAMYSAHRIVATITRRMGRAFTGQSHADISAAVALAYLQSIMMELLRTKLTASSDDAVLGYKNARIVINGKVMEVTAEVKVAGCIYFIPIAITISTVSQSA